MIKAVDSHNVRAFGTTNLAVSATNKHGSTQRTNQAFHSIALSGYNLILGYSCLKSINPDIDWSKVGG